VAVKTVQTKNNQTDALAIFSSLFKEFQMSARFDHPGIVKNYFFFWSKGNQSPLPKAGDSVHFFLV
jgi:hypothetical protein